MVRSTFTAGALLAALVLATPALATGPFDYSGKSIRLRGTVTSDAAAAAPCPQLGSGTGSPPPVPSGTLFANTSLPPGGGYLNSFAIVHDTDVDSFIGSIEGCRGDAEAECQVNASAQASAQPTVMSAGFSAIVGLKGFASIDPACCPEEPGLPDPDFDATCADGLGVVDGGRSVITFRVLCPTRVAVVGEGFVLSTCPPNPSGFPVMVADWTIGGAGGFMHTSGLVELDPGESGVSEEIIEFAPGDYTFTATFKVLHGNQAAATCDFKHDVLTCVGTAAWSVNITAASTCP